MATNRLHQPVIFIGSGRCGSTIISECLLSHHSLGGPTNYVEWFPKTMITGLMTRITDNALWKLDGVKGQLNPTLPFNSLIPRPAEAWPFWQSVTRADIDFSRNFLLYKRASEEEKERIRGKLRNLLAFQGKSRLGLKLTGPARLEYLHSVFPDAKFVHVVRDPTATVNSLLNVPFWQKQGAYELWWQGAYSQNELDLFETIRNDPVASTAFQLNKVLTTTKEEIERVKANVMTVHYEDFIASPSIMMKELLAFCDLTIDKHIEHKLAYCQWHNRNSNSQNNSPLNAKVKQWCTPLSF